MQRTLVRVRVEFETCSSTEAAAVGAASKVSDGCFDVEFDSSLALDIDTTEQALLRASTPALRDAMSSRLARVARERAISEVGPAGRIVGFSTPYPVDGEVGRFQIPSYDVLAAGKTIRTRTSVRCIGPSCSILLVQPKHILDRGSRPFAQIEKRF